MNVYKSKNSQYYFDENSLVRENHGEKKIFSEKIIYVSDDTIKTLLRKYDIGIRETHSITSELGDKLIIDSNIIEMDRSKPGGRFFTLIKNAGCFICYTGKIIGIEQG